MGRALLLISRIAARRRRAFVLAWVVLLVVALPFAGRAQSKLSNGGFDVPGAESHRNLVYFQNLPRYGAQPFTLLVSAPTADAAAARLDAVRGEALRVDGRIRFTTAPEASPDGRTREITGYASVSQNEALAISRDLADRMQVTDGPTRVYVLGAPALYASFQHIIEQDLARAETLTAPFIAVVLVALFGTLVAATLPIALAVAAVVITFGIVFFVASATEMSVFVTTMVSMIGIGVAVDYSMFVLARFREELQAGADPDAAVDTAMRTSGTAVVFSGLTVVLALLALWIVPVRAVQSMAAGAMMVVAVAVLASATLLPALLHMLGRRVDRGRVRRLRRGRDRSGEFWAGWVGGIMRRPLVWFCASAGLLVALTLPALSLETDNRTLEQMPRSSPIVVGNEILSSRITGPGQGEAGAVSVLLRPRSGDASALVPDARRLAAEIGRDPLIQGTTIRRFGNALNIQALLRVDPESEQAENELVPRLRTLIHADPVQRRATANAGGISAFNYDLNQEVGSDLWMVIAAVIVLAYVVLLVLLRSVLLPLKAVVMNLLSVGAAYGVIVAIFQWGWLDFAGFHHLGHLNTINPSLILAITFGLSMDYEVFLLTRIRERYEAHGSNERAVAEGIASSARIITSAAAIMVVVFGSFALTGVPTIKEIGVGLASAIAIDATLTRLVLVPATMRLLGDWNWWLPSWLDRRLPQLAHEAPAAGD
ncbi:MAG TPA: MMPL family transporter [Gaiellales bacterium]|nr:MMPL family transporter [Gaiellales bacterium]